MHGTLGAMLRKASTQGLDWVLQLPFALFALRASPNRDSLTSLFTADRLEPHLICYTLGGWMMRALGLR